MGWDGRKGLRSSPRDGQPRISNRAVTAQPPRRVKGQTETLRTGINLRYKQRPFGLQPRGALGPRGPRRGCLSGLREQSPRKDLDLVVGRAWVCVSTCGLEGCWARWNGDISG